MNSIPDNRALRIVAWLFLLLGLVAMRDFMMAMWKQQILIPLGLLGIGIFFGLGERQNFWRKVAMVFLGFDLVFIPFCLLQGLSAPASSLSVDILNYRFEGVRWGVFAAWLIVIWLLNLWELSVLLRPTVREQFRRAKNNPSRLRGIAGASLAGVALIGITVYVAVAASPHHEQQGYMESSLNYCTTSTEKGAEFQTALQAFLKERGFQPAEPERPALFAAMMPKGLPNGKVPEFSVRGMYDRSQPFYFRYGHEDMPKGLEIHAFTEWSVTGTKAEIEHQHVAVAKFSADLKDLAAKYDNLLDRRAMSATTK